MNTIILKTVILFLSIFLSYLLINRINGFRKENDIPILALGLFLFFVISFSFNNTIENLENNIDNQAFQSNLLLETKSAQAQIAEIKAKNSELKAKQSEDIANYTKDPIEIAKAKIYRDTAEKDKTDATKKLYDSADALIAARKLALTANNEIPKIPDNLKNIINVENLNNIVKISTQEEGKIVSKTEILNDIILKKEKQNIQAEEQVESKSDIDYNGFYNENNNSVQPININLNYNNNKGKNANKFRKNKLNYMKTKNMNDYIFDSGKDELPEMMPKIMNRALKKDQNQYQNQYQNQDQNQDQNQYPNNIRDRNLSRNRNTVKKTATQLRMEKHGGIGDIDQEEFFDRLETVIHPQNIRREMKLPKSIYQKKYEANNRGMRDILMAQDNNSNMEKEKYDADEMQMNYETAVIKKIMNEKSDPAPVLLENPWSEWASVNNENS